MPVDEYVGYCSRRDVEIKFGSENVRTWADMDNDGDWSAVQQRINQAIRWADRYIENKLRYTQYVIPLVPDGVDALEDIKDIAARLAGYWLYDSRGVDEQDPDGRPINRMDTHQQHAERMLRRYVAGQQHLPAKRVDPGEPAAPFVEQ
jgi:hypothetical protein